MRNLNSLERQNEQKRINLKKIIEKGSCIKIKNSEKIFQVTGINQKKAICWVRELPLKNQKNKTFLLPINEILISTFCPIKSIASN